MADDLADVNRPKAATPELDEEIVRLLTGWQDSRCLQSLEALMSTCRFTSLSVLAGAQIAPEFQGEPMSPAIIRHEARDFLAVAWAYSYFMDALADRVEARMN